MAVAVALAGLHRLNAGARGRDAGDDGPAGLGCCIVGPAPVIGSCSPKYRYRRLSFNLPACRPSVQDRSRPVGESLSAPVRLGLGSVVSRALSCGGCTDREWDCAVDIDVDGVDQAVSTGHLPDWNEVDRWSSRLPANQARPGRHGRRLHSGARAGRSRSVRDMRCRGERRYPFSAGDSSTEFSIQSISKAFVYALVCDEFGHQAVRDRIGVNNTGLAFNSVVAIELNDGHPMNPMVNAGAIATTALVPGGPPRSSGRRSGSACRGLRGVHSN